MRYLELLFDFYGDFNYLFIHSNPVQEVKVMQLLNHLIETGELPQKIRVKKYISMIDNNEVYYIIEDGNHRHAALETFYRLVIEGDYEAWETAEKMGIYNYSENDIPRFELDRFYEITEERIMNYQQVLYLRLLRNFQYLVKRLTENQILSVRVFRELSNRITENRDKLTTIDIDNPIDFYRFLQVHIESDQTETSAWYIKGIMRVTGNTIKMEAVCKGEYIGYYTSILRRAEGPWFKSIEINRKIGVNETIEACNNNNIIINPKWFSPEIHTPETIKEDVGCDIVLDNDFKCSDIPIYTPLILLD